MELDPSEAYELRRNWRKNWLTCLFEFSCRELQQHSWLTGSGEWVSSYVECMCTYFDDLAINDGYESVLAEGLLTRKEASLVRHFHAKADAYEEPEGDQYDEEAILADPAWQEVVAAAQAAWSSLKAVLSDPEELALVSALEAGTWKARQS
jgi:hypothetical protein